MNNKLILRLWGKTKQSSTDFVEYHPALFHMVDVAYVAQVLLSDEVSPRWQNILGSALNSLPNDLSDWLPYLIALHDIGKVSLPFQSLSKTQVKRLKEEGVLTDSWQEENIPHSIISQIYIEQELNDILPSKLAQALSDAVGGHHGWFVRRDEIKKNRTILLDEPDNWLQLRKATDAILRNVFFKYESNNLVEPTNISAAAMAINGFTILCDWIGSDGRFFQPVPDKNLGDYLKISLGKAKHAIHYAGLGNQTNSKAPISMRTLFFDIPFPRPLQTTIDNIPDEILRFPSLTIIEAPTGEGKTEAALTLAHRISYWTGNDELYYALPTMATSNQMFGRLQEHLIKRLKLDIEVKLTHGQASFVEEDLRAEALANLIIPLENGPEGYAETIETVAWFNGKKRTLIAPFGVGTVDQSELAALNVKHVGLRMIGLAGKTVIIDEVHAYDTYMTTVIERLLKWLAAMNTSVILLSATLPTSRRRRLAEAYCKGVLISEKANEYPCLMVIPNNSSVPVWMPEHEIGVWQPNREIDVQALHFGDEEQQVHLKAEWLLEQIADGGCACWITNTVKRAQNIFLELKKYTENSGVSIDLDLLHSQFPLEARQKREGELKEKYGRTGKNRPTRGIVIGTQVLEQSLDLDFDLMVSDLAPVDLLLQRAGRLHRHERKNRPNAFIKPHLWVNFETDLNGNLKSGTDRSIYARYIMQRTHQLISDRIDSYKPICLPEDYRLLIEAVYSDKAPSKNDPCYEDWLGLKAKEDEAESEAKERLIPIPHHNDSFARNVAAHVKFEDDENGFKWIVAKTRLGEETLNILPLERDGDWVYVGRDNEKTPINTEAPIDTQHLLLMQNMRISDPEAIQAIRVDSERYSTALFKKSALLKEYFPLWLSKGETYLISFHYKLHIILDPFLGLIIEKEKIK